MLWAGHGSSPHWTRHGEHLVTVYLFNEFCLQAAACLHHWWCYKRNFVTASDLSHFLWSFDSEIREHSWTECWYTWSTDQWTTDKKSSVTQKWVLVNPLPCFRYWLASCGIQKGQIYLFEPPYKSGYIQSVASAGGGGATAHRSHQYRYFLSGLLIEDTINTNGVVLLDISVPSWYQLIVCNQRSQLVFWALYPAPMNHPS